MSTYLTGCMQSKFYREDSTKEIRFDEVVGYLTNNAWLNDAVISYCLAIMSEVQEPHVKVYMLSSLVVGRKFPTPPKRKLFSMKFVMLSVNNANNHWALILLHVQRYGELRVQFYDPLSGDLYKEEMETM
ncbi:hypothetical protein PHMEG_0009441 [Phytophthora megakarya]|uniref:Ubiquitin-like protease family profile domain-containing protein n=1 Tax=Phytophthora megakarya TaxID=4795 RepID=A0A225WI91_9STRA|nr:hypothetical protein PHMEG_0009441 [Phytophthora megakarya]